MINTYDLDGVISLEDAGIPGVRPDPDDIIITGRSFEEAGETMDYLRSRDISNIVIFSDAKYEEKSREYSGIRKGLVISTLMNNGLEHGVHFEDDEIQIEQILKICPDCRIVHLNHDLTDKENKKR